MCRDKPVVRKAMVDLSGPVFKHFAAHRERWALEDCYRSPGPIQFGGGGQVLAQPAFDALHPCKRT